MQLRFTLRADGSTDEMLLPILRWSIRKHLPDIELESQFANPKYLPRNPSKGISHSIALALYNFPCDLLFIHRDAEAQAPAMRLAEIHNALSHMQQSEMPPWIPVIPVRMSEAWLMICERSIRLAAGNPNGKMKLSIPKIAQIETIADPKAVLCDLLRAACGLKGRRLKSFRPLDSIPLIAEYVADFTPLLRLGAYAELDSAISNFCKDFSKPPVQD